MMIDNLPVRGARTASPPFLSARGLKAPHSRRIFFIDAITSTGGTGGRPASAPSRSPPVGCRASGFSSRCLHADHGRPPRSHWPLRQADVSPIDRFPHAGEIVRGLHRDRPFRKFPRGDEPPRSGPLAVHSSHPNGRNAVNMVVEQLAAVKGSGSKTALCVVRTLDAGHRQDPGTARALPNHGPSLFVRPVAINRHWAHAG